ncbi:MAG: hypothetical protein AAGK14_15560 [Verrucomicrobiota bacterium]
MAEQRATVKINNTGVMLYGKALGHEPTQSDLLAAIPYEPDRRFAKMDNMRELLVFDDIGVCSLCERDPNVVHAIIFHFERPDWRELDDQDPKAYFRNPILMGRVAFTPPVQKSVADEASEQSFINLLFFFTGQDRGVAGLTIGFALNEAKVNPDY